MDILKSILQIIIWTVITGCGVLIVKKILIWANAKIDALQENTSFSKYLKLNKYIDTAQDAITTAVTSVAQTYTDSLKASGSFDDVAKVKAKTDATTIATTLITEDAKVAIKELFGDFEVYLSNAIEVAVTKLKG